MSDRGSVRYHRGGWELTVWHQGKRTIRRHQAPDTRAGRRSAEEALDQLATSIGLGVDGVTVHQLLELYKLARGSEWSPSTTVSVGHHMAPLVKAFGQMEVTALRAPAIQATYGTWSAGGAAAGTVRRRHGILAAALAHAVEWGMIAASPATGVKLPRTDPRVFDYLPDMGVLLDALATLEHGRLRVAARVAAATGMRRGEVVALRWADVDLDAGALLVAGAVVEDDAGRLVRKSTKGRLARTLVVDEGTVAVLRSWRTSEAEAALARGSALGAHVFTAPRDPSAPWHPGQVTLMWGRHREALGFPDLRWHDLRHLHATTLLAAGVPVTTVAARLGHASTRMTLDVYGHAIPARDQDAADVIQRAGGT